MRANTSSATERRGRSFLLDQKRRINRARRIIQSHNQIERRLARQPHMHRAVLMQHHARKRTPLALCADEPATLRFLQQTLRVKEGLRPRIAQLNCAPSPDAHENACRETRVTRAIQRSTSSLRSEGTRCPRPYPAAIKQASFALIQNADASAGTSLANPIAPQPPPG